MNNPLFHIAETFHSIQGEGNCAGINSLFLRFQYCNLTCSWCDTKFTWGKNKDVKCYSTDEVKQIIRESNAPNVILTGGEPTLYPLDLLIVEGKKIHVETNGTIIPTKGLEFTLSRTIFRREAMDESIIKHFNWVISPKLSNAKQEINPDAFAFWAKTDWCIFKFIIQTTKDLNEIETIARKYFLDKNKIYIGLEGNTLESQIKPELVDLIVSKGYNFSPRLHVVLWGNKRKK